MTTNTPAVPVIQQTGALLQPPAAPQVMSSTSATQPVGSGNVPTGLQQYNMQRGQLPNNQPATPAAAPVPKAPQPEKVYRTRLDVSNAFAPVMEFDSSTMTAEGRMSGLLQKDNPLLELERSNALQQYAAKGLANSSMGVQAGEQAVVAKAFDIASFDANQFLTKARDEFGTASQAKLDKLNSDYRLAQMAAQFNYDTQLSEQSYTQNRALNEQQFGFNMTLEGQRLASEKAINEQRFGFDTKLNDQKIAGELKVGEQKFGFDQKITDQQIAGDIKVNESKHALNMVEQKDQQAFTAAESAETRIHELAKIDAEVAAQVKGQIDVVNAQLEGNLRRDYNTAQESAIAEYTTNINTIRTNPELSEDQRKEAELGAYADLEVRIKYNSGLYSSAAKVEGAVDLTPFAPVTPPLPEAPKPKAPEAPVKPEPKLWPALDDLGRPKPRPTPADYERTKGGGQADRGRD